MTVGEREVLSENVIPTHYLVDLTPNLDTFTFAGKVTIGICILPRSNHPDLEVKAETSTITCNAVELTVETACVGSLKASNISFDEPTGRVTFTFASPVPVGKCQLVIEFQGLLACTSSQPSTHRNSQ